MTKKVLLISAIGVILAMGGVMISHAGEIEQQLTFAWEQRTEDLPSLESWVLHVREESGGPSVEVFEIPYGGGSGPEFSSTRRFTVSGMPGEVVTRYFVVTAAGRNGTESGPSNEVFHDFVIPWADVTTPINVTVTVTITGE